MKNTIVQQHNPVALALQQAQHAVKSGNMIAASDILNAAHKQFPNNEQLLIVLGNLHRLLKDPEKIP